FYRILSFKANAIWRVLGQLQIPASRTPSPFDGVVRARPNNLKDLSLWARIACQRRESGNAHGRNRNETAFAGEQIYACNRNHSCRTGTASSGSACRGERRARCPGSNPTGHQRANTRHGSADALLPAGETAGPVAEQGQNDGCGRAVGLRGALAV